MTHLSIPTHYVEPTDEEHFLKLILERLDVLGPLIDLLYQRVHYVGMGWAGGGMSGGGGGGGGGIKEKSHFWSLLDPLDYTYYYNYSAQCFPFNWSTTSEIRPYTLTEKASKNEGGGGGGGGSHIIFFACVKCSWLFFSILGAEKPLPTPKFGGLEPLFLIHWYT